MSSSGYTAITFVANEQPTTAKWNLIGSNDASFNNGNGFEDEIIINRHIGLGAVIPKNIDLSSIGVITSSSASSNFSSTTDIQSASVVIPTGCTKALIIGSVRLQTQNGTLQDMQAWVDYDSATAVTKAGIFTGTASFQGASVAILDRITVSAGTKTFKIRATTSAGGLANCGIRTVFIIPLVG